MLPKISHPTTELIVPSTKVKVRFRPMLVKDEKILLMAKASGEIADILSAIKQVINSCAIGRFDVDSLALFDLEYLFVKLRATSINNIAKVTVTDEEDGKEYPLEFDFNKVEVKFPEEAPEPTIPISDNMVLVLRYPRASVFTDKEYASDESNPDYFMRQVLDKVITDGDKIELFKNATAEEIKAFVDELPIKTSEAINAFWSKMPHLYYAVTYKNSTGKEQKIELKTLSDFFPFR